jgi:hypothetical protein
MESGRVRTRPARLQFRKIGLQASPPVIILPQPHDCVAQPPRLCELLASNADYRGDFAPSCYVVARASAIESITTKEHKGPTKV